MQPLFKKRSLAKGVSQADIWEKNIPTKRNIQRKDLKVGKSLEYVKNQGDPCNGRRLDKGERVVGKESEKKRKVLVL